MTRKARTPAWIPVKYEIKHIGAVQALHAGTASAHQQKLAFEWIIEFAAETYNEPFRSESDGGDRETTFALGRAFVGRQIIKLVKMSPELISALRKAND